MDDKPPLHRRGQGYVAHFQFRRQQSYFRMAEWRFCMQVEYIKCKPSDGRLTHNWRGQFHVTRFFNFASSHIFWIGKAMHFKLRVLIDTQEY